MADKPRFVRHFNEDRFESICTACFMTAATASSEADLPEDEVNHICREEDLSRVTRPDYPEQSNTFDRIHLIR